MAKTRTLAVMRAAVREQADIENTQHITDAAIDRHLNKSLARLYNKVVEAGEDDYLTSVQITTVAGQEAYALPATFYQLRHVEVRIGSQEIPLDRWDFANRHRYTQPWGESSALAYRLVGNDTIRILPIPTGGDVITVWYYPALADLVADADTFDGRNGWEEIAILDAAIKCRLKSEEDISGLVLERDGLKAELAPAMQHKDRGKPNTVQDTTGGGPSRISGPKAR